MARIGERIKEQRKRQGLTQERLAEILHVGKTTVSKWESGKNLPQLLELKNMSSLFQVSSDYLLGLTDSSPIKREQTDQKSEDLLVYFAQLETESRRQAVLDFAICQFSEQENAKLEAEALHKALDDQDANHEPMPEVNIIVDSGLELEK